MSLLSKLHAVGRSKKRAAASGSSVKKTAEKPVVKSEAKIAAAHVGHPKANVVLSLLDTSGVSPKKALKIISECEAKGFGDAKVTKIGKADLKWLTPILLKAGLPVPTLIANARDLLESGFDRKSLSGLTVSQVGHIIAEGLGCNAEADGAAMQGVVLSHDVVGSHNGARVARIKGFAALSKNGLIDLRIPEEIAGLPVCIIGKGAFQGCGAIRSVQLPDSVDLLGASSFEGCSNLQTVELPPDLEAIQQRAFANCPQLRQVVLPYSLKRIASEAFLGCKSLDYMPHYVRRGIGATMNLDRSLLEEKLPSGMEYIGNAAFKGCSSLKEVFVPYQVPEIKRSAFEACESLSSVGLHLNLEKIGSKAFKGCPSLKSLRLPDSLVSVGEESFDPATEVVYTQGMPAAECESFSSYSSRVASVTRDGLSSQFVPGMNGRFYTDQDLRDALESFELRSVAPLKEEPRQLIGKTCESRFFFEDGVFKAKQDREAGRVVVRMTGDLMCCPRQQKHALEKDGEYDFSFNFSQLTELLQGSDITIGNMESMSARSFVFADERCYVDDRVHLNCPEEFIHAVSEAGYDVVVNAQNHAYDAGLQGVFETLDALNRQGLIHTGLFVSESDQRYILLEANGIRIGLVSYFDQARQPMKRVNYTEKGLSTVFSTFDEDRIKEDIAAARTAGAEFIIAYCHWGREYTTEITSRQEGFAVMVANAGADFLLGSHSHNLQPYSSIETNDGRKVPVLYSAGNFVSDMSIYMPGNIETAIVELTLVRNQETSKVEIETQGYHPCVIQRKKDWRGFVRTVPLGRLRNSLKSQERKDVVDERAMRIAQIIGDSEEFPCLDSDIVANSLSLCEFPSYKESLKPLPKIRIARGAVSDGGKYEKEGDGVYKLKKPTTPGSATLTIAGYMDYSSIFECDLTYGSSNMFPAVFADVKAAVKDSDLAIGALGAPHCVDYLTSGAFSKKTDFYKNADIRYYDAIADCGFDCLALASKSLEDCGPEGLSQTLEALQGRSIVAAGASDESPIFNINGINVAVLSYIEDDGARCGVNRFSPEIASADIKAARERGAEFVLVYAGARSMRKSPRVKHAQAVVDAGADYVICGTPRFVSGCMRLANPDGVEVPVISSTGMLASAECYKDGFALSPVFRIELMRKSDGRIAVKERIIPAWRSPSEGVVAHQVRIVSECYSGAVADAESEAPLARLTDVIGDSIAFDKRENRIIKDRLERFLSPKDVFEIIGVRPTDQVVRQLGDAFDKKANGIVAFESALRKGCIAFELGSITYEKAVESGAVLLIGKNDRKGEIPVVSVSKVLPEYLKCMEAIRGLIKPYVVGITGTMGKTTTKEFMHCVFEEHYRTLCIEGNNNTVYSSGCVMQKVTPAHEAYVQEIHGGTADHAAWASRFLRPNIAVITGIGPGHLEQLGSIENIVKEKMRVTEGLQDGGLLILNNDSPELAEQDPSCRVVRCSRTDSSCDYYAKDIRSSAEGVDFTICFPEGECAAAIRTPGEVNVNNALVVFAAACEAGIPVDEIVRGLARYRPKSLRANVIRAYGYNLMIDCYNSNPKALREAAKAVCSLPVEEGGRHIAVLGHMGELADDAVRLHRETGKAIAEEGFDLIICCGSLARHFAEGAIEAGVDVLCAANQEDLNRVVVREIKPGDAVLFKASHALDFEDKVVKPLFGQII